MMLYRYLCIGCGILNHIHWEIVEDYHAPYCCNCGVGNDADKYKFIKIVEVKNNDN